MSPTHLAVDRRSEPLLSRQRRYRCRLGLEDDWSRGAFVRIHVAQSLPGFGDASLVFNVQRLLSEETRDIDQ